MDNEHDKDDIDIDDDRDDDDNDNDDNDDRKEERGAVSSHMETITHFGDCDIWTMKMIKMMTIIRIRQRDAFSSDMETMTMMTMMTGRSGERRCQQ